MKDEANQETSQWITAGEAGIPIYAPANSQNTPLRRKTVSTQIRVAGWLVSMRGLQKSVIGSTIPQVIIPYLGD